MVRFHNAINTELIDAVVNNEDHRLAFARKGTLGIESKSNRKHQNEGFGFFAPNNALSNWTCTFQTTLPTGAYCDVYRYSESNANCDGTTINVCEVKRCWQKVASGRR